MGNILLHFEYEGGQLHDEAKVTKIYVGVVDWGRALYMSEVKSSHRVAATKGASAILKARENYPHLAPELLDPYPDHYSKETDIYSVGNILNHLLNGKGDWESGNLKYRVVCPGWRTIHQKYVELMVSGMCHQDPKKRSTTIYWIEFLVKFFGDVGINRNTCDTYVRH